MTLSDRHLQLLTAFVDGELTRRQRKAVLRLLHRSSEARTVLLQLQENAHRLKTLTCHKLGPSFTQDIMAIIQQRGIKPERVRAARRMPVWVKIAAAAACLLVAVGSLYFATQSNRDGASEKSDSLRLALKDINHEANRQLVASHLQNRQSIHLNFIVKSNSQAINRLSDVLEGAEVRTIIDSRARAQLKKEQGGVQYYIYAENLKPEEVESILRRLASQENSRKSTFDSVVIGGFELSHRETLSGLFGADIAQLKDPPKGKSTSDVASQYTSPERLAMILASTAGEGTRSPEIEAFLAQRQVRQPGTVQVLIVISQSA